MWSAVVKRGKFMARGKPVTVCTQRYWNGGVAAWKSWIYRYCALFILWRDGMSGASNERRRLQCSVISLQQRRRRRTRSQSVGFLCLYTFVALPMDEQEPNGAGEENVQSYRLRSSHPSVRPSVGDWSTKSKLYCCVSVQLASRHRHAVLLRTDREETIHMPFGGVVHATDKQHAVGAGLLWTIYQQSRSHSLANSETVKTFSRISEDSRSACLENCLRVEKFPWSKAGIENFLCFVTTRVQFWQVLEEYLNLNLKFPANGWLCIE